MDVSRIRALRGPNLWSRHTAVEAIVQCSPEEMSLPCLVGFEARLRALFPQVGSLLQPGGKIEDVSLAHVLTASALGLQAQAGCPVTFSRTNITPEMGVFQVVVEYTEEAVGKLALAQAQTLVQAAASGEQFDVSAAIATLREMDEDTRLGPSTGSIVNAARARNIPFRRLTQGSLVQVLEQGQSLIHNRINLTLAKQAFAYLRLSILRGAEQLQIHQITAEELLYTTSNTQPVSESWSLAGTPAAEQSSQYFPNAHRAASAVHAFEFSRQEHTPAEYLSIDLGNQTYANSLRVLSRPTAKDKWQLIYQGIWFQTQVGEQWQKAEPIKLSANRAQFWRLEFAPMQPVAAPKLVFSWQPIRVQFIANNAPPFVLALSDDNGSFSRQQVFNQILAKHRLQTGEPAWINADLIALPPHYSALKQAGPGIAINWRQWLFWLALLGAVALLAFFALRLIKQLNLPPSKQD